MRFIFDEQVTYVPQIEKKCNVMRSLFITVLFIKHAAETLLCNENKRAIKRVRVGETATSYQHKPMFAISLIKDSAATKTPCLAVSSSQHQTICHAVKTSVDGRRDVTSSRD